MIGVRLTVPVDVGGTVGSVATMAFGRAHGWRRGSGRRAPGLRLRGWRGRWPERPSDRRPAQQPLEQQPHQGRRGKRDVRLGPTEFRLLDVPVQRPGRVFSRERLLDRVWGQDVYVEICTVDVPIGRLRKALNRRGDRDPIRTVRSSGYALDETSSGRAPKLNAPCILMH